MADGRIIIDTEIQTDGMKPGTKEIEAAVRRMSVGIDDLGKKSQIALQKQAASFTKLNQSYAAQEQKVKRLREEIEKYGNTRIPTQEYTAVQNQISETERRLSALQERQDRFLASGGKKNSNAYKKMQYDMEELTNTIKYAKAELRDMEQNGTAFTFGRDTNKFSELSDRYVRESQKLAQMNNTLGASYARVKNEFNQYRKRLLGIDGANKKATKSGKQFNKTLKNTGKSANKGRMSLGRMMLMSIALSTVFRAISAVASGMKEGIDNLALYSDDTNKALSLLMSRLTQLKNSFATAFSPVIEFVAPALAKFISLLAEAVTWTGQLFAALSGKDTFVKAVKVEQDYADSLDESKDKTDELRDATEKLVAPFDNLIQLQGGKKDSDKDDGKLKPSDMFETVEVSNQMKELANDIKATFSTLFDPLKQSWEANGPLVIQSVKNAFSAVKQLASDVGASFMQVWNVEGYGKQITDDLLITFANLAQTVANLVNQFDKAWKSGDTGTNIIRHLGDIVLIFTGFLREASESIKNWADKLDFSPLLESFDRILVAVKPIVSNVGDLILWLLNKALLPLAKWGIEQALPTVFDLIAAALEAVHSVIEALRPLGEWLWNSFLQPIGEWTGKAIISALEKVVEWLTKFSDWVRNNQTVVENITLAVVAFFAAWKFVTFVSGILKMISMITTLSTMLSILGIDMMAIVSKLALGTLKFTLLTAAIAGVIAIVAILAKNWNNMSPTEKVISSILAAASAVAVLAVALGAVKGAAGAALVAGALAAGIAAATIAINAGKRAASSSGYSTSGYSSYPVSAYSAIPYEPPMLATGTVVPPRAGISYFGIGDNNHEPEVVSPLSTIEQALENVLAKHGLADGGKEIHINMYVKDRVFAQAVYEANNKETQRVGVRMVSQNA